MIKTAKFKTSHDTDTLINSLSDPSFLLPKLFPPIKTVRTKLLPSSGPPIKTVRTKGSSYEAEGRFLGMRFYIQGSVLVSGNEIVYSMLLNSGGKEGVGKLTIRIKEQTVEMRFEYEGWMERISGIFFMDRWFSNFIKNMEEYIGEYVEQ